MSDSDRANPFAELVDLNEFKAKPKARTDAAIIDKIADASQFPSRTPQRHETSANDGRYRTGRNIQFNIKAKEETIQTLKKMARDMDIPIAAAFERAVQALADRQT